MTPIFIGIGVAMLISTIVMVLWFAIMAPRDLEERRHFKKVLVWALSLAALFIFLIVGGTLSVLSGVL